MWDTSGSLEFCFCLTYFQGDKYPVVLVRSAWPGYFGMEDHPPSPLLLGMYFSTFCTFLPFDQTYPLIIKRMRVMTEGKVEKYKEI